MTRELLSSLDPLQAVSEGYIKTPNTKLSSYTNSLIQQSPEGGRNWEGFSPDPFLSGEAVRYTVMGHQAAGVQTSTKHFIGN